MNICYIFCALDCEISQLDRDETDYVIAADAGFSQALKIGIKPDAVVGDFDSLKSIPECENTAVYPVRKDDTDFLLAIKAGLEKGYKKFIVYGAVGARLDHTLGAVQGAAFAANRNASLILASEAFCITAIKNSSAVFNKKASGIVSVFALNGEACGVTISGLSYNAENITVKPDFPIGVSNEFTGEEAKIEVKNGILTVMWQGKPSDIILSEDEEND